MTSRTGPQPPVHRRFSETKALAMIRNRYRELRKMIPEQVARLQPDPDFRRMCASLYERGYKDWVILSAIYNCMFTWQLDKTEFDPLNPPSQDQFRAMQDRIQNNSYPAWRFVEENFDTAIMMHNVACLQSYGFELLRPDIKPPVIEAFLRHRMKHFEFDIEHPPMFGDPPGDWPSC